MLGSGPAMSTVYDTLRQLATTRAPVLVTGETGVGKPALCESVHRARFGTTSPCWWVDCERVSDDELERALEAVLPGPSDARGGTMVLREICELTSRMQERLVAFLEAEPDRARGVHVVATSRRLLSSVRRRERMDARLSGAFEHSTVEVPPLRARPDDVIGIAHEVLQEEARRRVGGPPPALAAEVLRTLQAHDWPGNAAELCRLVATTLSERGTATATGGRSGQLGFDGFEPDESYRGARQRVTDAFEVAYVDWLLDCHGGNLSAAARAARMDRKHLYDLARKHGRR